jgi:hypothetical protein
MKSNVGADATSERQAAVRRVTSQREQLDMPHCGAIGSHLNAHDEPLARCNSTGRADPGDRQDTDQAHDRCNSGQAQRTAARDSLHGVVPKSLTLNLASRAELQKGGTTSSRKRTLSEPGALPTLRSATGRKPPFPHDFAPQ